LQWHEHPNIENWIKGQMPCLQSGGYTKMKTFLIAIGITAAIMGGGFLFANLIEIYYRPNPTNIELTSPTITKVSGDNITGYTIWLQSQELDIKIEKGKPYSIILKTEDIEKAIEDYEASKVKPYR
jgi:hypothetical protein